MQGVTRGDVTTRRPPCCTKSKLSSRGTRTRCACRWGFRSVRSALILGDCPEGELARGERSLVLRRAGQMTSVDADERDRPSRVIRRGTI